MASVLYQQRAHVRVLGPHSGSSRWSNEENGLARLTPRCAPQVAVLR